MRSVLQNVKTGRLQVENIPPPLLGPGTVLVRNAFSLVSAGTERAVLDFSKGSYLQKAKLRPDLVRKVLLRAKNEGLWQTYKIVANLIDQPIQLGYSCAGVIEAVGSEIDDLQPGQRVACAGLFAATHSEVISVSRNLVVPVPDALSLEEASFVALSAIAMQGLRLAEPSLGDNVVVYGLGLVGMLTAQLAAAAGARVFGVDIDPKKIELLKQFGCEGAVADDKLVDKILQFSGGFGADKVLMCAATKSSDPIKALPQFTRQKGVLVVVGDVGMDIPRRDYFQKEIDIRISRSYGPGRYDPTYEGGGLDYPYAYVRWTENRNMSAALDLAARGRVNLKALITHRFEIAEAEKAYELIRSGSEPYLGITLSYPEAATAPIQTYIPVAASTPAASRSKTDDVRLGVIGAGNFAKAFLLPAFTAQKGVGVRSVCTASGASAFAVAKKYQAHGATSNAQEILHDPQVDLVLLATRHDSHARYIIESLEADKAVFVEKPLATTLDDLNRVAAVYRRRIAMQKSPFLMVGYNRRFSPLAQTLKETFSRRNRPLSIVYRVNAGTLPADSWVHDVQISGGRIIGECCHFIDFISFLTGGGVELVGATGMFDQGKVSSDVVTLTLRAADGSLGTIHYAANGHPGLPKEYVEVHCGGASAQLLNFRKLTCYGIKACGRARYFEQQKGFAQEASVVVDALRTGKAAPIEFDDLYATCLASIQADEAVRSGRMAA